MSISPPITRAPAAVILFVAIALVQTLSATAAAVAIRPPSVFLAIDMPATVTPPKARLWHGRIDQAVADDGFAELQTMYNGTGRSSGKKGGPSATKGDKKLQGSKLLFQTHERLGAVIEMLEQFAKDVNNPQVNRTELKRSAKKIKTYAVPMLKSSRSVISSGATAVAPIPRVSYVHKRGESQKKKGIRINKRRAEALGESACEESVEIQMMSDFVAEIENNNVAPPPAKKKQRLAKNKTPLVQFKLDVEPAGGEEYSKKEVCEILSKYKPRSGPRVAAMKAIIEHNAKYVEGCSKPTINRLMIAYGEKKFDRLTTAWSGKGRPAVLSDKDINGIVESIKGKAGEAFSSKDIEGMMSRKITEHLDRNGIVQLQEKNISPSTVSNYTAMLADQSGISIVNATTRKPNTRYASENSLRGAVALISMVGSTHFIPTKLENDDIRQELKTMPNSTRLLTDMVSIAWGCPVFPVDPRFLFSTDDTTEYTFEGVKGDEHQFVLTSTASAAKRGTSSVYTTDTSNAFKGMRVKLTFTFSGLGTCLPLVATVAGLTEHEMPDTDFKVVKIPDLCIGGGVDVDSNRHGYLILMRGGEGADLKRFRWYQEHILIPGIKAHRLKYGGFDSDSGAAIPDHLTAISYCDGDFGNLSVIKENAKMLKELKIVANKQNAARSAVEQPADLAKVFKIIKELLPNYTATNLPPGRCPVKDRVSTAFLTEPKLQSLKLRSTKKGALIDFLAVIGDVATRACSSKNIRDGFVAGGYIDDKVFRYPVLNKLLATCRRNITKDEYENVLDTFEIFLSTFEAQGHIPEELFDMYGFVHDYGVDGQIVRRDAGITQEQLQRAKCLTHDFQINLRKQRLLDCQRSERLKKKRENAKHQAKIDANAVAVKRLVGMLKDDDADDKFAFLSDSDESALEHSTLEHFFNLRAQELVSFITARNPQHNTKSSVPAKGTLQEAKDGARKSVLIAFESRAMPNRLLGSFPHDLSDEGEHDDDELIEREESALDVEVVDLSDKEWALPSQLLSNDQWVEQVKSGFNINDEVVTIFDRAADMETEEARSFIGSAKAKADLLLKILRERYKAHVQNRISKKSKRNHWVMKLAYKNLNVVAAVMVMADHVKEDITCIQEADCILASSSNNFIPCRSHPKRQGVYGYYDNNRGCFVRSGKVTRRGFDDRGSEHEKGAKAVTASSHFYEVYPSKSSSRAGSREKQGFFESLQQVILVGFDPISAGARSFGKDVAEGGILLLDEGDKTSILASMNTAEGRANPTPIQKFHDIISYQFEFGYDLAIAPELNVSQSPGFESVLGIFGGSA